VSTDREPPSRREFVSASGSALGGAWLLSLAPLIATAQACASDARRDGLPFVVLTEREGADFEAFAARIIPTDDTPGATEAGVVYFADRALDTFLSNLLPTIRAGLSGLGDRAAGGSGSAQVFTDLSEERQDELIVAVEREDPDFFSFARTLVMMGFVTNPEHGGNREGVGWQLLGFEDRFAYQPPFGYYDRNEHGDDPSGGADR
jgi:gluconate 2-dehydrogenase gamma chain